MLGASVALGGREPSGSTCRISRFPPAPCAGPGRGAVDPRIPAPARSATTRATCPTRCWPGCLTGGVCMVTFVPGFVSRGSARTGGLAQGRGRPPPGPEVTRPSRTPSSPSGGRTPAARGHPWPRSRTTSSTSAGSRASNTSVSAATSTARPTSRRPGGRVHLPGAVRRAPGARLDRVRPRDSRGGNMLRVPCATESQSYRPVTECITALSTRRTLGPTPRSSK